MALTPTPRCPKCDKFLFFDADRHACPPLWEVASAEDMEDESAWRSIYALDDEQAAENWAGRYDSEGDYTIVNGSPHKVAVRRHGDSEVAIFEVHGETVAEYHAHREERAPADTRKAP